MLKHVLAIGVCAIVTFNALLALLGCYSLHLVDVLRLLAGIAEHAEYPSNALV